MIDLHSERVAVGTRYKLPASIVWTLYTVTILAMITLGSHFGLSAIQNIPATTALVVSLGLVLLLIIDLDQQKQHLFSVPQDPLADLFRLISRDGG